MGTLAPQRLQALRRVATMESIGSSTRIEGSRLTDKDVAALVAVRLAGLSTQSFRTDAPDWRPWVLFFPRSLSSQVSRLEEKVTPLGRVHTRTVIGMDGHEGR